jgi:hypothetical protein
VTTHDAAAAGAASDKILLTELNEASTLHFGLRSGENIISSGREAKTFRHLIPALMFAVETMPSDQRAGAFIVTASKDRLPWKDIEELYAIATAPGPQLPASSPGG